MAALTRSSDAAVARGRCREASKEGPPVPLGAAHESTSILQSDRLDGLRGTGRSLLGRQRRRSPPYRGATTRRRSNVRQTPRDSDECLAAFEARGQLDGEAPAAVRVERAPLSKSRASFPRRCRHAPEIGAAYDAHFLVEKLPHTGRAVDDIVPAPRDARSA